MGAVVSDNIIVNSCCSNKNVCDKQIYFNNAVKKVKFNSNKIIYQHKLRNLIQ